jgi:hypothetical protein
MWVGENLDNQEIFLTNNKEGLQTLLDKYGSIRAVSRATGVPKSTLGDRITKYGLQSPYVQQTKGNITFNDRNPSPTSLDVEDLIEKTIALQCSLDNTQIKQTNLSLEIKDNKPIGIAFWSDWHVGSKGTDHLQWKKDVDTISHLNGFYYLGNGDYINLAINDKNQGEHFDELLKPEQQILLANWAFEKTKKQALGLVRGCHPDRIYTSTGTDIIDEFCNIADCANLWHGAEIKLQIGDIEYIVRIRHKGPNESPINTTNAQRKQLETHGEADIVALAHLHYPDVEQRPIMGRNDVVLLRSGTYKIGDEFGQKLNGYKGTYGIPIVVLYPKEKRLVPFKDFDMGVKFLMSERS